MAEYQTYEVNAHGLAAKQAELRSNGYELKPAGSNLQPGEYSRTSNMADSPNEEEQIWTLLVCLK